MKLIGKVLFFNEQDGNGIIMTAKKEKITFSVADWDDFDTMPSLGLEVRFMYEKSVISSIVSINYKEEEEEEEEETQEVEATQEVKTEQRSNEEDSQEEEPEQKETEESSREEDSQEKKDSQEEEKQEESDSQHFEDDQEIAEITTNEEIEDELGEREESVTVTLNLPKAVANYFNIINENITKRTSYKKAEGRLDYLVIRRFLWTTYNNLSEIDLHIITPKIKALSDDLKEMALVYDDFARKVKYPVLAYEEVFLSCQAEYTKIKEGTDKVIKRINQLKGSEKYIDGVLKVKKEEIAKELQSENFEAMQTELKSLNGTYVDVVHMMAELDERYKHDMKLLIEFEKEYKEDFYNLFNVAVLKYQKDIIDILSAQAYVLDEYLWHQAKASKAVKVYFHRTGIKGEFNTKTYLKYYLDTQDAKKATGTNKKLFELYEYLVAQDKSHVMVVLSEVSDVLDFEASIKRIDNSIAVKGFIDEKKGLKWAIKHSIKVLIVESQLTKMHVDTFLSYYKKYVLVIPKIILLGNSKSSDSYTIHKLLPRGISAKAVSKNVAELLVEEKKQEMDD